MSLQYTFICSTRCRCVCEMVYVSVCTSERVCKFCTPVCKCSSVCLFCPLYPPCSQRYTRATLWGSGQCFCNKSPAGWNNRGPRLRKRGAAAATFLTHTLTLFLSIVLVPLLLCRLEKAPQKLLSHLYHMSLIESSIPSQPLYLLSLPAFWNPYLPSP